MADVQVTCDDLGVKLEKNVKILEVLLPTTAVASAPDDIQRSGGR